MVLKQTAKGKKTRAEILQCSLKLKLKRTNILIRKNLTENFFFFRYIKRFFASTTNKNLSSKWGKKWKELKRVQFSLCRWKIFKEIWTKSALNSRSENQYYVIITFIALWWTHNNLHKRLLIFDMWYLILISIFFNLIYITA